MQRIGIAFAASLFFVAGLFAQATTSLTGSVSDGSGAVIPGAMVTLSAAATGVERSTTTDERGLYQFLQVAPGKYSLVTEMTGFSVEVVTDIELLVATPATLDVTLEVGEVTEIVTVEADAVALNTTDATVGNAFTETKIRQLPLITRNVVELMSLQTGVNQTGEVLGARKDQNNVTLDGVDVNDQQSPEPFGSVLPVPLDSVQEFRVTTGGGNADLGRSSGGQVSLVTKGGTNELHGSLYEFHRNTVTAANTFFNNSSGVSREKLIRNQYGFSVGGPVIKNRAFFFFNYEGRRDARSASQLRTVPSETLKQGILTVAASDGNSYQLTPAEFLAADPAGLGSNPRMLDLLKQFPAGNDPAAGTDGGANFAGYRFNAPLQIDNKAYVAKMDFNLDKAGSHRVSWRGTLADNVADLESALSQYPGIDGAKQLNNSRGFVGTYTGVLTPTLINTFNFGYTRQGVATSGVEGAAFNLFDIDELQNFSQRASSRHIPTYNISNDLNWVRGNHNYKFGTNIRFIRNVRSSAEDVFPSYGLSQGLLGGLGADIQRGLNSVLQQKTGNASLELDDSQLSTISGAALDLTGAFTSIGVTYQYDAQGNVQPVGQAALRRFATEEYELYFSDNWRIRPSLTLTYGLRYSYSRPPYETNGLQGVTTIPLETYMADRVGAADAGVPANALDSSLLTWVAGGPANNGPNWYNPDRNNFAPRFALAWNPQNPTGALKKIFGDNGVFRIGAGVFYDRYGNFLVTQTDQQGTFGVQASRSDPTTYNFTTAYRYDGGFPALPAAPTGGFPFTPALNRAIDGSGITAASNLVAPYSIPLTATFSREVPGGMTLELGYVGRLGRKLLAQHDPASPLIFFKDPKSGQTLADALQANRTLFEDQGLTNSMVASNPGLVPNQPFFENMFPGLANYAIPGSASANFFYVNNDWGRESELDTINELDRELSPFNGTDYYHGSNSAPNCIVATGCYTFFAKQFSSLPIWENLGSSNFHGMTISLRKRFTEGLSFDFNYTWSHSIDNSSAAEGNLSTPFQQTGDFSDTAGNIVNTFRRDQSRGDSDFDIRQQFNTNFLYELPFGRGKKLAGTAPGWVNQLIGGWQISGLMRYRTGLPVSIANGSRWSTNYYGSGRALIVGDVDTQPHADNADGVPGLFYDGRVAQQSMRFNRTGLIGPRNIYRLDDFFNTDLALGKRFFMPFEGHTLQFRWEVFNAFNNVNFTGRGMQLRYDRPAVLGQYRNTSDPRIMQFALRYEF
ncbi:MAG: carboxypeptidase regulatory-like domain-containing protein [Acidobacteria bacterium]|nr:carboxypeptidase regulatory-like domain-containing protein [Acidobacteriota bacterium]